MKTEDYETLLPGLFGGGGAPWHVLHVKSRQEKALTADLRALSIPHFLPLVRQVKFHGGRKVTVETPLFPGYVFLRGTVDEAYQADRTRRVAGIIKVADQKHLDWELRNIHLALTRAAPLVAYAHLKKGVRVRVTAGPMAGLEGMIKDHASRERLVLQVNMLGQAVSLEVDGGLLEVIE